MLSRTATPPVLQAVVLYAIIGGCIGAIHQGFAGSSSLGVLIAFSIGALVVVAGPMFWAFVAAVLGQPAYTLASATTTLFLGSMIFAESFESHPVFRLISYVGLVLWLCSGIVSLGAMLGG